MSPDDLLEQIETDERWLRRVGVEVGPPPDLEAVKRRVRLAIDECWLAEQDAEVTSAFALARVKERVHGELATAAQPRWVAGSTVEVPVPPEWPYRVTRTLAAAAALLLAAGVGFWSALSPAHRPAPSQALDELASVLGRQLDDDLLEWEAIDAELTSLEETLAQGSDPDWDDVLLDDLGDEIDELMVDFDLSPDVS